MPIKWKLAHLTPNYKGKLGPLLFIIFVNNFFAINIMSSLVMFANDTITLHSGQNLEELIRIVENDMKVIYEWLENNQLITNREKTYAMHFPPSSHKFIFET